MDPREHRLFLAGLFCTTFSTLLLEILDARLLSVLTWYHLSFFAISLAMFGLSAGGLHVYLAGPRYAGLAARTALARYGIAYALVIPLSHIFLLRIPLELDLVSIQTSQVIKVAVVASALLAAPFYCAGIIVGLALTRMPARIGVTYSVDLVGAGLGCLVAIPALRASDVSTAIFAAGAVAAIGAAFFQSIAGGEHRKTALAVAILLTGLTAANRWGPVPFRVIYAKGTALERGRILYEAWNGHSQILAYQPVHGRPFYWGRGLGAEKAEAVTARLVIDGSAETYMTLWDGMPSSLEWVQHDVTSLPYHMRPAGDVAVIGVGGGRDVLTALWANSRRITGIEMNDILIDLVSHRGVGFSRLPPSPTLQFVHDDARSYLTRTTERYDVLQMSLIDSWASTTAGAFTLSENGLYTREAWKVFLDTLKEGGIFSVSRWFSPDRLSETDRLLVLGTAALIDRHVADRAQHIALVSRGDVATLLVSTAPFSANDLACLDAISRSEGFTVLAAPGWPPADPIFKRILASGSHEELRAAVASQVFDYSPPSDERPYFFNMIKPRALVRMQLRKTPGIVGGNLLATTTLLLLVAVSTLLVVAVILVPLVLFRGGRSSLSTPVPRPAFVNGILYFAFIGAGFMLIQIPYMQRFSVYLGHPTHALVVILFSMILSTGIGSFLSERLSAERRRVLIGVPAAIVAILLLVIVLTQPVIDATIRHGLFTRALVVVAFTAPLSLLLGCCFPLGMRLVSRVAPDATPWMWGMNGACSVLASSLAVAMSMWSGIHSSLWAAMLCYAALAVPALALLRLSGGPEKIGTVRGGPPT